MVGGGVMRLRYIDDEYTSLYLCCTPERMERKRQQEEGCPVLFVSPINNAKRETTHKNQKRIWSQKSGLSLSSFRRRFLVKHSLLLGGESRHWEGRTSRSRGRMVGDESHLIYTTNCVQFVYTFGPKTTGPWSFLFRPNFGRIWLSGHS